MIVLALTSLIAMQGRLSAHGVTSVLGRILVVLWVRPIVMRGHLTVFGQAVFVLVVAAARVSLLETATGLTRAVRLALVAVVLATATLFLLQTVLLLA